jgi:hypothetical protein
MGIYNMQLGAFQTMNLAYILRDKVKAGWFITAFVVFK